MKISLFRADIIIIYVYTMMMIQHRDTIYTVYNIILSHKNKNMLYSLRIEERISLNDNKKL